MAKKKEKLNVNQSRTLNRRYIAIRRTHRKTTTVLTAARVTNCMSFQNDVRWLRSDEDLYQQLMAALRRERWVQRA